MFTWPSGNYYEGNYENDERNGKGEMFWMDGSYYKGDWVNGVQHGRGTMTFADGVVKRGLFENNVFVEEMDFDSESDSSPR